MKHPNLQVTYRRGRLLAAYIHLSRKGAGEKVSTRARGEFVVDFAKSGRAIGIEILGKSKGLLGKLNALLDELGHERMTKQDIAPIGAA